MSSFYFQSNRSKFDSLINELGLQNFEYIRFSSYRTACKLRFIQRRTNFYLVDLWNTIEAIRENGLHAYQQFFSEISYSKLETLIASIYYQLNKRLPPSQHLNIDESITSLLAFLTTTYDPNNLGKFRVFAIKIGLSTLCSGNIVDKLKYAFSLISDLTTGYLKIEKFNEYLRELLALTYPVFETSYQYYDGLAASLLDFSHPVNLDIFVDLFLSPTGPPLYLSWFVVLHKIPEVEQVVHETQCSVCHRTDFAGFRYKCKNCFNYHLCQDCFWRGRASGSHRINSHICKEYTYWKSPTKRISHTLRKSFRCIPSNKKVHYSEEFPINHRINLSHIIPPSPMISQAKNGFLESYIPETDSLYEPGAISLSQYSSGNVDEEHRLIARYAAKLADHKVEETSCINEKPKSYRNSRKQQLIAKLEAENSEIMRQIQRLKEEQIQLKDEMNRGSDYEEIKHDSQLIGELSVLRSRKEELESHLNSLMDTRRELKSQLERLVHYLKNQDSLSDPSSAVSTFNRKCNFSTLSFSSQDNEISSFLNESDFNRDLLTTADSVSNAISSLVRDMQFDDASPSDGFELIRNLEKGLTLEDDPILSLSTDKSDQKQPYKQLSSRSKQARRRNKLENFQTSWNSNSMDDDEDIYAKTSEDEIDDFKKDFLIDQFKYMG